MQLMDPKEEKEETEATLPVIEELMDPREEKEETEAALDSQPVIEVNELEESNEIEKDSEKDSNTAEDSGNNDEESIIGESRDSTNSDDSLDYSVWDYTPDSSFKDTPDYYYNYPGQPCHSLRGASYTPPGWKRRYHRKRNEEGTDSEEEASPTAPKKLQF